MSGKPSSTIAFEQRWNPLFSGARERFIEELANVPLRPEQMHEILRFNQERGEQPR